MEKYCSEQKLTTLKGLNKTLITSLPNMDTVQRSVCLIRWEESNPQGVMQEFTGTGFLVDIPGVGVAFLSAGHNFEAILDSRVTKDCLTRYTVHFNNPSGNVPSIGSSPPKEDLPMNLGELLQPFNIYGSISFNGKRVIFKEGNTLSYDVRCTEIDVAEDYCALLLNHKDTKSRLKDLGLSYLPCGEGQHLENTDAGLVAIFGHPGDCPLDLRGPICKPCGVE